jgi:hypothetical protein
MAIAKGSRCRLAFKEESTFGVIPAGDFSVVPFSSESLVENINTIRSDEIRANRTVPDIRGGNIASGGGISSDFGINRHGLFFKHLLGSVTSATPTTTEISWGTSNQAVSRGEFLLLNMDGSFLGVFIVHQSATIEDGEDFTILVDSLNFQVGETREVVCSQFNDLVKLTKLDVGEVTNYSEFDIKGASSLPSAGLCFEKQILGISAPQYYVFKGARIGSLELTVPQEGMIKCNWGIVSLKAADSAATNVSGSLSLTPDQSVVGYDAYLRLNQSGSGSRPFRDLRLTITNGIDENVYCIGERTRREVPEGLREVSGSISLFFETSEEYNLFKREQSFMFDLSFVGRGGYLRIAMPEVKLTGSGTPQINGAGVVTASFDFNSFQQDASYDIQTLIRTLESTLR